MAKKLGFVKFLTAASTVAIINGTANSTFCAEVTSQANPSAFNTAGNWDVARILANQDYITLGGDHAITANLGLYIEDIKIGTHTLPNLTASYAGSLYIGNITKDAGGTAGTLKITNKSTNCTLVGGDRNARTTPVDYSGINALDFSNSKGGVTVDTNQQLNHHISGNVVGAGDALTLTGSVSNAATATLRVYTDLNVSGVSWLNIGSTLISNGSSTATMTVTLGADATISNTILLNHEDAELCLDDPHNITFNTLYGIDVESYGRMTINTVNSDSVITTDSGGTIGFDSTYRLKSLSITGSKNVTLNMPVYSESLITDIASSATVTLNNSELAVTQFNIGVGTVALDNSGGARTIDTETVFSSDAGGKLLITGANNATITGNIATGTVNRGTVEIDASVDTNIVEFQGQIGDVANTNALNLLDIKGDSTVTFSTNSNVHIKEINFAQNGVIKLTKSSGEYKFDKITTTIPSSGSITFAGTNILLDIDNTDSTLPAIKLNDSVSAAGGIVNFTGNVTIKNNIGSEAAALSKVIFVDDDSKTNTIEADIYATNITTNGSAVTLSSTANFTGDITTNATTFDINSYTLKNTGNLTIAGTNTVTFNMLDTGANSTITGGAISSTGILAFANGSILILQPQDNGVTSGSSTAREFVVATASSLQGVSTDQIQLVQNKIKWKVSVTSNGIALVEDDIVVTPPNNGNNTPTPTPKPKLSETIANLVRTNDRLAKAADRFSDIITSLNNAATSSPGEKLADLLIVFADSNHADKFEEALDRVTKGGTAATVAANTASNISDTMADRALNLNDSVSSDTILAGNDKISGVAAGDDNHHHIGIWSSPFYGKTAQGAKPNLPGYTNEFSGMTLGMDTKVNEDTIIGTAITASYSNVRHKNSKSGDKTKITSTAFSIYYFKSLANQIFVVGTSTFSRSRIRNYAKRVISTNNYEIAGSNYNANAFSIKGLLGYANINKTTIITPMLGFKYTRSANLDYQESDTSFQNLKVSAKGQSRFEAILGIKGTPKTPYNVNNIMITPEIRGFVNYTLNNHTARQKITMGATEWVSESGKPSRIGYNLGLGVSFKYKWLEYRADYDLYLSDKLTGHQGSLKVRANF
jgi:outer membrane autotransporter protein